MKASKCSETRARTCRELGWNESGRRQGCLLPAFNRANVGQETRPVTLAVAEDAILRFATVIGETDPLHLDRVAARKAGHAGLVAPPTFAAVLIEMAGEELRASGHLDLGGLVAGPGSTLLHGEETYRYLAPIVAGQQVEVTTRVLEVDSVGDGRIERARFEITVTTPEGGPLVTILRTVLQVSPR